MSLAFASTCAAGAFHAVVAACIDRQAPSLQALMAASVVQVDPLVSLMKVEKVPDSTYDMIGGLDQQIKEIKEVRWTTSFLQPMACVDAKCSNVPLERQHVAC